MSFVKDPYSTLQILELSHEWGHGAPSYPGQPDVSMHRAVKHAQHGVLAWKVKMGMHSGTHMNAPINMIQRGEDLSELSEDKFFGNGVVLSIPKGSYEVITAEDLQSSDPGIREGDVVVIVTGWNKSTLILSNTSESHLDYQKAAQWLVNRKCKLVAMDTQQIDHPMATSLGPHRGGPTMRRLEVEFVEATGLDPKTEHGEWNIANKTLLGAGIPTIEQVGGDVDEILGKRATFAAIPWKLKKGDACPVRFIAIIDPEGEYRIPDGK